MTGVSATEMPHSRCDLKRPIGFEMRDKRFTYLQIPTEFAWRSLHLVNIRANQCGYCIFRSSTLSLKVSGTSRYDQYQIFALD